MTIPGTLKIGGHIVRVRRVGKIGDGDRIAQVQVAVNRIDVARQITGSEMISESMVAEGLLHEIIHYVLIQGGYGAKEKMVSMLAAGLFGAIRENNLDFRYVKEGKNESFYN